MSSGSSESNLAGVVAAVIVFALLGIGLGALMRDQVAAVVGLLVCLFVAEPIVTRILALQDWTVFLPGPAVQRPESDHLDDQDFLQPLQGGLVLTPDGSLIAAAGLWRTTRIDLT